MRIDHHRSSIESAPIVRLLDEIFMKAIAINASDIHIEPLQDNVRVRCRVDGDLLHLMDVDKSELSAMVTRIKILADIDISEKRLPQDGSASIEVRNKTYDMRVSTIPIIFGEKIVLRILDKGNFLMAKEDLGFTENNIHSFEKMIHSPHGIILLTGPTGSGKSTTLYTILDALNELKKNIITIEDPVEYRLEGINQMQINKKAGLTFSSGLRSILRQDPDIVMVGEIRDAETAEIAVRASITGHLVLSTIHTNDAVSTITRLIDMGIEPYLVATALVGVISQRLVKKICPHCKVDYVASPIERRILEGEETVLLSKGTGCEKCNHTGYLGRCAVHEVLAITENIRNAIEAKDTIKDIKKIISNENFFNLKTNCTQLVLSKITTMDELNRIIYTIE